MFQRRLSEVGSGVVVQKTWLFSWPIVARILQAWLCWAELLATIVALEAFALPPRKSTRNLGKQLPHKSSKGFFAAAYAYNENLNRCYVYDPPRKAYTF